MLTKTLPESPQSAEEEEVCDNKQQTDARAAPDVNVRRLIGCQVEMPKPSQPAHIVVVIELKRPTKARDDYPAAPLAKKFKVSASAAPAEQGNAVADGTHAAPDPDAPLFKVSVHKEEDGKKHKAATEPVTYDCVGLSKPEIKKEEEVKPEVKPEIKKEEVKPESPWEHLFVVSNSGRVPTITLLRPLTLCHTKKRNRKFHGPLIMHGEVRIGDRPNGVIDVCQINFGGLTMGATAPMGIAGQVGLGRSSQQQKDNKGDRVTMDCLLYTSPSPRDS